MIFSDKTFAALGNGEPLTFSTGELLRMAAVMAGGVLTGKLRVSTIRSLLRGMQNGSRAKALYASYPADESGYDAWVIRAETFWKSCGSMAENTVK